MPAGVGGGARESAACRRLGCAQDAAGAARRPRAAQHLVALTRVHERHAVRVRNISQRLGHDLQRLCRRLRLRLEEVPFVARDDHRDADGPHAVTLRHAGLLERAQRGLALLRLAQLARAHLDARAHGIEPVAHCAHDLLWRGQVCDDHHLRARELRRHKHDVEQLGELRVTSELPDVGGDLHVALLGRVPSELVLERGRGLGRIRFAHEVENQRRLPALLGADDNHLRLRIALVDELAQACGRLGSLLLVDQLEDVLCPRRHHAAAALDRGR